MSTKEGHGLLDRRARFEQLSGPGGGRQFGIWLPGFFIAPDPVTRETLGIQPSLGKTIIKAHVDAAVALGLSRNEPNSRVGLVPIFIIAEQNPICVGEHENRARVNGQAEAAEKCQGQWKLHPTLLSQRLVASRHRRIARCTRGQR